MKAKRSNYTGLIAMLLVGAVGVYAVGVYVSRTPEAQNVPQAIRRDPRSPNNPGDHSASTQQSSATILTPKSAKGELTFESKSEPVPAGTDPIVFALNRFLDNTTFVPANARAVSVDVRDGIAYISFTEGMQKPYGSSDEATILQGICKTLSNFPNIQKVQFEIEGKPMDPIGNVDLSEPLDVNPPDGSSTQNGA